MKIYKVALHGLNVTLNTLIVKLFEHYLFYVLSAALHGHQLPLGLGEGADQARQLARDAQRVADGQAHHAGVRTRDVVLDTQMSVVVIMITYVSCYLDDGDERDPRHHGAAEQLQPELEPLGGGLARVVCLEAALEPLHVLPHEPRHRLHRADRRHAGQGLAEHEEYK